MGQQDSPLSRHGELPTILIAAVAQGWVLYALHTSVANKFWPATRPAWLLALYAIAILTPVTIQMLASYMRERTNWLIVGVMSVLFAYFGWHHGAHIVELSEQRNNFAEQWIPFGIVLAVLWLLMLPFIQARIATGRWRAPYAALFSNAWNNKLVLAEAALFTGLFWLLLMLMQQLFFMLGIKFFRELFSKPVFIYPVTSITFGVALHLIGSLERLTKVILEQLLNVLKWLALLAGIILALFTLALAAKLPGMIASGERAIGAAWLLWLIAVTVLLVNAAYRDGNVERPYPRAIAFALRLVIPLTVVIALTALYAMYLRIERYGFTVDRVWACVVAGIACVYSIGYALAARDKGRWMASIARVNVATAVLLMSVLALTLTPVLSPYRIAAASQFRQILQDWPPPVVATSYDNPMRYLRLSAGDYGRRRLRQLERLGDHPNAAVIRRDAKDALARNFGSPAKPLPSMIDRSLKEMTLYPGDRSIDPQLLSALTTHLSQPEFAWRIDRSQANPMLGVFIDMDGNDGEEFVLISSALAFVFKKDADDWAMVKRLVPNIHLQAGWKAAVQQGDVHAELPQWKELHIGRQAFRQVPSDAR